MNYEQFIDEQKLLANLSIAYKNDPEFQGQLDTNPKSIFRGDLAETESEVVIMHNSDSDFYFILPMDMNGIISDEETSNISAAKFIPTSRSSEGGTPVLYDTENDKYYRRVKSDEDHFGLHHFIEVRENNGRAWRDIKGAYLDA